MKSNTDPGLRHLGLILALTINLALWSLAGIALAPGGVHQSGGAGLDNFGLLQWKTS